MGADVVAHVKGVLASTAVDDEVSEYVAEMVGDLLSDGEVGRSRAEMVDELVDATGPMLGEFVDEAAVRALCEGAVAHFVGDGGASGEAASSATSPSTHANMWETNEHSRSDERMVTVARGVGILTAHDLSTFDALSSRSSLIHRLVLLSKEHTVINSPHNTDKYTNPSPLNLRHF